MKSNNNEVTFFVESYNQHHYKKTHAQAQKYISQKKTTRRDGQQTGSHFPIRW